MRGFVGYMRAQVVHVKRLCRLGVSSGSTWARMNMHEFESFLGGFFWNESCRYNFFIWAMTNLTLKQDLFRICCDFDRLINNLQKYILLKFLETSIKTLRNSQIWIQKFKTFYQLIGWRHVSQSNIIWSLRIYNSNPFGFGPGVH